MSIVVKIVSKMSNYCLLCLLGAASFAWAQKVHVKDTRVKEKAMQPVNWSRMMELIDQERTLTVHEWRKRYAQDRNEPAPERKTLVSLQQKRNLDLSGVDRCFAGSENQLSYGEMISKNLDLAMKNRRIRTDSTIDKGYQLSEARIPVGLYSHRLCATDPKKAESEFRHSLMAAHLPGSEMAKELNEYLAQGNKHIDSVSSSKTVAGFNAAVSELKTHQGILMSCLAYAESLTQTETDQGKEIFGELSRTGRRYFKGNQKPDGVLLGLDRPGAYFSGNKAHTEQTQFGLPRSMSEFTHQVSGKTLTRRRYLTYTPLLKDQISKAPNEAEQRRLKHNFTLQQLSRIEARKRDGASDEAIYKEFFSVIPENTWVSTGVYQFKFADLDLEKGDSLGGNIGACVDQWNDLYGASCPIQKTIAGYAQALASPGQAFNIFCGTQKILQSYNVQIHTTDPAKTSPQNLGSNGKLLPPEKRCVHPFWFGSLSYNHFGTLSNSIGKGGIPGLKSFPGNLSLVMECLRNNGARVKSMR